MPAPAVRHPLPRWVRGLAGLALAALLAGCSRPPAPVAHRALEPGDWTAFKEAFLRPEGRIIDPDDGEVSHSEGQGCAMILAEAYGDRASFDRLWEWTRTHLQIRPEDKLLAGRWRPGPPAAGAVDDPDNATEGDLLVAWALTRAGVRWKEAAYTAAARVLCREVRTRLIRPSPFGPVLLPGTAAGFERGPAPPDRPSGSLVLKPSDWVFPAFPELYRLDPDAAWPGLQQSGSALLRGARFGPGQLPADRVETPLGTPVFAVDRRMGARAVGEPPVFGDQAMRVPLYLRWSGRDPNDELLAPFNRFWGRFEFPEQAPAVVNVETGQRIGPANAPAGAATLGRWLLDLPELPGPRRLAPGVHEGYRASVLLLLTRVGRAEARR